VATDPPTHAPRHCPNSTKRHLMEAGPSTGFLRCSQFRMPAHRVEVLPVSGCGVESEPKRPQLLDVGHDHSPVARCWVLESARYGTTPTGRWVSAVPQRSATNDLGRTLHEQHDGYSIPQRMGLPSYSYSYS